MAEEKNEEMTIDSIAKKIADKVLSTVSEKKANDADLEKKNKVSDTKVGLVDRDVKLFKTKKGREVLVKKSLLEPLGNWGRALLRNDKSEMHKIASEINTKLEPLNETTAADGGYLVPTVLTDIIVPMLEDEAVIRPRATILDLTGSKGNHFDLSTIASKPVFTVTGEQTDKSTSSMVFGNLALTPYKLAVILTVTNELIEDSAFNVVSMITKVLGESLAKLEDQLFTTGTGTNEPTGLDAYTYTTISAGNALSWTHLNQAFYTLPQAYQSNACWIMNSRVLIDIANMVDSQNRPILMEPGFYVGAPQSTPLLKGRPVLQQNNLGSSKILFVDLSQYYIGVKKNLKIDQSTEAYVASTSLWQKNLVGIRAEERIDGELATTRAGVEISNTGVA